MNHCTTIINGYASDYAKTSCLPHTGMNVGLVLAIGVGFLLVGLGLFLLSRTLR